MNKKIQVSELSISEAMTVMGVVTIYNNNNNNKIK